MDGNSRFMMSDGSDPHINVKYHEESQENVHSTKIQFLTFYHSYNKPMNDYLRPRLVLLQFLSNLVSQDELQHNQITHGYIDLTSQDSCTIKLASSDSGDDVKLSYKIEHQKLSEALEQRKQEMLGLGQ